MVQNFYRVICLVLGFGAVAALSAQGNEGNMERVHQALLDAGYPKEIYTAIAQNIAANKKQFLELLARAEQDNKKIKNIFLRADKQSALPSNYKPDDLVSLDKMGIPVNSKGLLLRAPVAQALRDMVRAARKDGVSILTSSTYRSYSYQKDLFARYTKQMGEAEAARVSARAGTSQHQLGTTMDFGNIEESFADTAAGKWLVLHGAEFGFSLSYPQGKEAITGYIWEPWHWRYLGTAAVQMQKEYFLDMQQYLIMFFQQYFKK